LFSGETWLRSLRRFSSTTLEFTLEGDFYSPHSNGCFTHPTSPWMAFLVSFGYEGQLCRKPKRKEVSFSLRPITGSYVPGVVGLLPLCPGMVSPLAKPPSASMDTTPPSECFPCSNIFAKPVPTSVWSTNVVSPWLDIFPYPATAALARASMSEEGSDMMFAGDRSKGVRSINMISSESDLLILEEKLASERDLGFMAGPFEVYPFPNVWFPHQPRITPLGLVPKHEWDPLCDKFRIVSVFSHRDSSSINSLSYSPKLISFHVQPWHIRVICSFLGPHFQFFAIDVVNAFRNNTTRVSDLYLFVYQLVHNKFYVGLRHCFGHTVSEWIFATITAVLRNAMLSELGTSTDSSFTLTFVDSWWILSHFGDGTHLHRCDRLKFYLRSAGLTLHEEQTGPVVTALGWEWHRDGFFTYASNRNVM
jgi:hypothetical protein